MPRQKLFSQIEKYKNFGVPNFCEFAKKPRNPRKLISVKLDFLNVGHTTKESLTTTVFTYQKSDRRSLNSSHICLNVT